MKIIISLLFMVLVAASTSLHIYFVWKNQDRKMLKVQMVILSLVILGGILVVYDIQEPSIASLFNLLSPLEK